MVKRQRLAKSVEVAAAALFKKFGPESAVIVMVGIQDGKKHSAFQWSMEGRCLPIEGLLVRCAGEARQRLWKEPRSTSTAAVRKEKS